MAAYRRMVEPAVVELNADDSADTVLDRVLDLLRHHSILQRCVTSSTAAAAAADDTAD